jgi:hypothetical protein
LSSVGEKREAAALRATYSAGGARASAERLISPLAEPHSAGRLCEAVALVIGNADYLVGALQNPINDVTAVAETLERQPKLDFAGAGIRHFRKP